MIPLNDLKRATSEDLPQITDAVQRVLKSGWFILGPELEAFENEFATYQGDGDAVGVGNGTDAIEISLIALGVGPGDLIATTANSGGYATTAIKKIGAIPVYIDVDSHTALMSANSLENQIKRISNIKCIILTHLYGNAANVELIRQIANMHHIYLLEDCAQAIGAEVGNVKVGNFSDIATFSFFPTKNLGAIGDAGCIYTRNKEFADRIKKLRQYGWKTKYRSEIINGQNSRLDEIQAAVLRFRLNKINEQNSRRRSILEKYAQSIKNQNVKTLWFGDSRSVGHLAVLAVNDRSESQRILQNLEIASDIHYPILDFEQAAWSELVPNLNNSKELVQKILTIPCFPQLKDSEIEQICDALSKL
jgi:dTDP-4-amino-4,6-dideoxygalactose transaminase